MNPSRARTARIAELAGQGFDADLDPDGFDAALGKLGTAADGSGWSELLLAWTGCRFPPDTARRLGESVQRTHRQLVDALGRPVSMQTALLHELHSRQRILEDPRVVSGGAWRSLQAGALVDPQSGVYNRRYLDEYLDRELGRAERGSQVFSIVLVEVAGLSAAAEEMVSEAGAVLAASVARRIRASLRVVDVVGRFEADRFLILLPDTDLYRGIEVADRIGQDLRGLELPAAARSRLTIDYAVATFPLDGRTRDFLLKMADVRLFASRGEEEKAEARRHHPRFVVPGFSLRFGARSARSSADVHDMGCGGLSFLYRAARVPPVIEGELAQRFTSRVHPVVLRRVNVTPAPGGRIRVSGAYAE